MTTKRVTVADLKESFPAFLCYVWQFLRLPPPTPKQLEMAQWLADGVPEQRQILMAFRGIGKSWITATFCVWLLWRNPQEKILVISASGSRANSFSLMVKRLITDIPFLKHMKPDSRNHPNHRWSNVEFDVADARIAQSASVKSVGITGQITGSRATRIICDDVEVPDNSATVMMREKLLAKVLEVEAIILPGGTVYFLGTPQTEESIYVALRNKGYITRIWPARVPEPEKLDGYYGCLAPSIAELVGTQSGRATDTRFSDAELAQRENRWGRSGFALQFMLDTSLSDTERYPLKLTDLVVVDQVDIELGPVVTRWSKQEVDHTLPHIGFSGDYWRKPGFVPQANQELTKYEGRLLFIDPSGRGADECAAVVLYQLHGKIFWADLYASKDGYGDDTLRSIALMGKKHKVNNCVIEANFGDGMFSQLIIPWFKKVGHPCSVEEVKHSQQKEQRIIDTLEPVMNQHRLVVDRGLIERDLELIDKESTRPYSAFYQMTRLTKDRGSLKHDDRLDALAGGVSYWIDSMARSTDDAADTWRRDREEDAIREFLSMDDPIRGGSKAARGWGYGASKDSMLAGFRPKR